MIDALLVFYAGKNSKKRKKIKQVLNSLTYDESTKEFRCKSTTNIDKEYIIFYSTKAQDWFCNCRSPIFQKYKTFENLKDRKISYLKYGCCHILGVKIWKALNKNENEKII